MKSYTFTLEEMSALRDAMIEEFHRLRSLNVGRTEPNRMRVLRSLIDQFKEDVALVRPPLD